MKVYGVSYALLTVGNIYINSGVLKKTFSTKKEVIDSMFDMSIKITDNMMHYMDTNYADALVDATRTFEKIEEDYVFKLTFPKLNEYYYIKTKIIEVNV